MNRILASLLLLALAATASAAAAPDTGFGGTGVVTASLDDTNLTTAVVGCHVHSDASLFLLIAAPDGMYVRNVDQDTGATRTAVWASGQLRLAGIDPRHALYMARRASPPTNPSNQFRIVAGKPMLRVGPAVYRFNADGSRDVAYGLDGDIQAWQNLVSSTEAETGRIHLRSDGVVEAAVQRTVVTTGPVVSCTHLMRRWDAAGVPDATFGTAGQAILTLPSSYDFNELNHMVSASDGTALVAQAPAPYRVLSDGSLDTGFRANAETALTGIMVTPLAIVEDAVGQAATTAGKKYVVGKQMPGSWEVNLVRLNADGTLDGTFATTLLWTTAGDPGQARIVVTSAGISVLRVAAESESNGITTPSQTEVRRVLTTGGIDSAFNGGLALGPTLSSAVIPFGVAVDSTGILSAFGAHNAPVAGVVARFDATGAPISTFATVGELTIAGLATTGADLPEFCLGLADGRLLVGAQVLTDVVADEDFNASARILRRYTVAGALDPSFGSGGQVVAPTDAYQRTPDFEVLFDWATGGVQGFLFDHYPATYGTGQQDGIVWYNADGQFAFGVDGLITFPLDYRLDEMALVQGDGKLLLWGQYGSATTAGAVARITAAGAFDSGFAGTGYASYAQVTNVTDMVRCQDGTYRLSGLLMTGTYPDQVAEARVLKLNADGSVDTGFGGGGVLILGSGSANDPGSMAKVRWEDTGDFHYAVRGPATGAVTIGHVLATGLPDGSFGSGGTASHDLGLGTLPWQIDEFVRTSDGKLMLSYGVDLGDRKIRTLVVRFTAAGAIDVTYGSSGFIDLGTIRLPAPLLSSTARALKTDFWFDGTLRAMPEIWEHSFLLRPGESLGSLRCFDANGQPDTSIATGGVLAVPGMTRVAHAWQSAGVLSVVGANDTPDLMVARFLLPAPVPPVVTSPLTASGIGGNAFSYTITASNGPTSFSAGTLPAGLTVDSLTGAINGAPSVAGIFPVTIGATNAYGTGTATLTITITAPVPVITSGTSDFGAVGMSFSYTITASNSPTSYGASGLPAGLTVNATNGLISGIPTVNGDSTVILSATNAWGTGTQSLSLSVSAAAPVITSLLAANGVETAPFSYQITASNTPSSYGASGLPAGLSVDAGTGLITGTPTGNGVSSVIISATNATGTGSDTLVITIAPPTPVTVTVADQTLAYDGASHSLVATASNPAATFAFGYELLNPDRVTYQASATAAPTAGGTYRVTATAGGGYSGSGIGTLVILPCSPVVSGPAVTASTMPTWSWTPAGGGTGQYRYKLDDSDLSTGSTTTAGMSFTAGSALADGPHLVYVQEQNQSGDWSASGAATVVVDSLGTYSLPIITPPGGDFTGSVTVTLGTAVSVGGLSVLYTLDGSDPAISPTAMTYVGPMVFKAGERLRVVARNGGSTSPESTATLRVVGDPTLDVLPPELWSVSSPSVGLGNTLSVKIIHGTPPYSVAVSGASYFTPEAMVNTYDFKKDGVACAGIWVDVVADRIGTITVTVTDSLARSLSATASAVVGGSVVAVPAAVTPSTSTAVSWTALSPQTMAGVERLLAVAGSTDRTQFRGLWYDAPSRVWRDLPEKPVGGQLPMSGFYVASRQSVDLTGSGAPMNSYSQIGKIYPGWNLVGVPAVVDYMGTPASGITAASLRLLDEDGVEVPAGYPAGMLRVARWAGGSFQHLVGGSSGIDELSAMTESLACGAAYCIYNGTTTPARPLYLMVDPAVLPMGAPRAAGRSLADKRVGSGAWSRTTTAPVTVATSVNSYASRYGGEPAAPPGAGGSGGGSAGLPGGLPVGGANGSPVALPAMSSGSGGGGCGLGSGLGLVALGGALALAGRLRRRR
jgi:uncharacterized delta-60 repeat protein